jgi:cell filamentation protein
VYEIADDTYCYPGTSVLINKIGTRQQDVLDQFEMEMTSQRAAEPMPPGKLDYVQYCAIHHHLFQDVYSWAGKPRTVRISKGGNPFCFPENIDAQARKLFAELARKNCLRGLEPAEFAKEAAHFLAELNAVHPFREGNGRAQLSFLALLAQSAEHPLDAEKIDPEGVMEAMIASFHGEEGALVETIARLIEVT